jgi:arsenite-transporting ATPase
MAQLAARVKTLRAALVDPRRSSYRLVLTPDRTVLREAQRAETYLNLFEYPIDAVLVNRLFAPSASGDSYLDALIARQQRIMAEVRAAFGPLPLFEVPLTADEPVGVEALARLGATVFGDADPTRVLHVGPSQRIERRGRGYVLRIPMPNVEVDRLELMKRGNELYVEVGTFRREVALPNALSALEPGVARVHAGMLEIPFQPDAAESAVAS